MKFEPVENSNVKRENPEDYEMDEEETKQGITLNRGRALENAGPFKIERGKVKGEFAFKEEFHVKNELKMEVDEEELPVNPENEDIKIPAKRAYRSRSAGFKRILIADKYEYGRIVSSGMIGIVYLAREFTKDLVSYVCIKRMMGEKMAEKRIFPSISREIKILQKINKIRGCIKMQDLFMDEKSLSLVFPYYSRGDLYTHSKVNPSSPLKEHIAQSICRQLVETLLQVHKLGIIHRDLKPENILVDDGWQVVIADFGFAIEEEELKKSKQYTRVGTLEFYPIEMLAPCFKEEQYKDKIVYDRRVDIWSMGVVVFELLYGRTPFYTGSEEETKKKIRAIEFKNPVGKDGKELYPDALDLMRRIFVRPLERITLKEILNHPWL